ncbi:unnamed protein product [Phytophthora lilii]|uniref:Unnamed protein product n=1 Tax=Phytophthora lilii TaxID=2077276 RepID=A0A9W6WRB3_9STRA|nr:unnamed protein product [Phytophthora lilii]
MLKDPREAAMLRTLLALLVAIAVVSGTGFAIAEEAALTNPASTTKLIGSENNVSRLRKNLRRNPKVSEERIVPVAAFAAGYLNSHHSTPSFSSQTSQSILHTVQGHKPLPKWAKALLVLLGLVAAPVAPFSEVSS